MLRVVDEHGITVKTNPFNGLKDIEKVVQLAESGKMKGKGIIIMDPEQIEKEKKLAADL
jgi:propanol-preferring alcohol dehydrogenase